MRTSSAICGRERFDDDHQHTLAAANHVAWRLYRMGRYVEARDLGQENLHRYRRVLSDDHPDTLASARNLAHYARQLEEADP